MEGLLLMGPTPSSLVQDDSWYWGLALSFGIRSKAQKLLHFNEFPTKIAEEYNSEKRKVDFQLWGVNLVFAFVEVPQAQSFGCFCLKCRCAVNDAECELYFKEEADQAKEQAESEHEVEYTSWYPEYNYDIWKQG